MLANEPLGFGRIDLGEQHGMHRRDLGWRPPTGLQATLPPGALEALGDSLAFAVAFVCTRSSALPLVQSDKSCPGYVVRMTRARVVGSPQSGGAFKLILSTRNRPSETVNGPKICVGSTLYRVDPWSERAEDQGY
jgi:hypothetical protein